MAKAKITFNLNDIDDLQKFHLHGQVDAMYCALFEIKHNLKRKFKHNNSIDWDTADLIFKELEEITSDVDIDSFS
jgi:hypothetical protein